MSLDELRLRARRLTRHDYANVPEWARETLSAHERDARPALYTPLQLARGETDDATWNAVQKQFTARGWMHNTFACTGARL